MRTLRVFFQDGRSSMLMIEDMNVLAAYDAHDIEPIVVDYYTHVVFVAVHEMVTKHGFIVELGMGNTNAEIQVTEKILAKRLSRDLIEITSATSIGIKLDLGGEMKRFLNGDQIDRAYKVFALAKDAQNWIREW